MVIVYHDSARSGVSETVECTGQLTLTGKVDCPYLFKLGTWPLRRILQKQELLIAMEDEVLGPARIEKLLTTSYTTKEPYVPGATLRLQALHETQTDPLMMLAMLLLPSQTDPLAMLPLPLTGNYGRFASKCCSCL